MSSTLLFVGKANRFDSFKCEWGFDKFISLKEFVGEANRFDKFFGVEVFICEGLPLGECYSISKFANISGKYKWVVTQFSGLKEPHDSDEFVIGGYKWYVHNFLFFLNIFISTITPARSSVMKFRFQYCTGSFRYGLKATKSIKVAVFLYFWCLWIPKVPRLSTR